MPSLVAFWFGIFLLSHVFMAVFTSLGPVSFRDAIAALMGDAGLSLAGGVLFSMLAQRAAKLRVILMGGISFFLGFFLLTAFGFARLYERPFAWSFIRTDTLTIWKENFVSALYEFGVPHAALGVMLALLFYLTARRATHVGNPPARMLAIYTACSLLLSVTSFWIMPKPPALFSNPVFAAFGSKAKIQVGQVTVSSDDVIPDLDSPEGGYAKGIDLPRGKKKNVILYFLESTPYSIVGKKIQGKEITPNLNRLRERSQFFTRHYANFPLSINAFYNAVCGAYALPDGAWISLALPDFPVPCLSQILKKQGYRTAGIHAGYLGYAKQKRFMQKHDFDFLADAETIKKPPYTKGMGPWGAADERAMIKPLSEFAAADPQKPFLAVLFAFAPHHPYDMPDGYGELIADDPAFKKQQKDYFNSMHFADDAFGTVLAELTKKGLMKDTILIAFGDHGEAFYEHRGNYNHPFFIYEENIRAPLFIWYDGITPGETNRVTSHVDILPTVLDLLDLKKEQSPMHVGRSMLKGGPRTLAHLQAFWHEEFSGIVDERYKFIRKETGARELYDLTLDPGEQKNLAEVLPELATTYNQLTEKAFAQKKAYYKKYGNYELVRFKPSSQDK